MKVEQQNLFTGQYDVVYDDQPPAIELKLHRLSLEPFLCECCEEAMIVPEWEEYYDDETDTVYNYYHHCCSHCQFEDLVDNGGFTVTHIAEIRQKEAEKRDRQKRFENLVFYDRRLL